MVDGDWEEANGEAGRRGIRGRGGRWGDGGGGGEAFFFPRELGEGKRMKRRRRGTARGFIFPEALGGGTGRTGIEQNDADTRTRHVEASDS